MDETDVRKKEERTGVQSFLAEQPDRQGCQHWGWGGIQNQAGREGREPCGHTEFKCHVAARHAREFTKVETLTGEWAAAEATSGMEHRRSQEPQLG